MSLLWRARWRALRREPGQSALLILSLALGVAVVVAVDLVNAASRAAMATASAQLQGASTHRIEGPGGSLSLDAYGALRRAWRAGTLLEGDAPVMGFAPILEGRLPLPDGSPLRLLGIDPFSSLRQESFSAGAPVADAQTLSWTQFLTTPGAALLSPSVGPELAPGDRLPLPEARALTVLGRLPGMEAAAAPLALAVVDLATAQEWLGATDRLSRVELALPEAQPRSALRRGLERLFPGLLLSEASPEVRLAPALREAYPGLELRSQRESALALGGLASAFQLNLAAMGLLALLVGLYLLYGALAYSVRRRLDSFGRFRALGVAPAALQRHVLLEALTFAGLGALLGLLLGRLLAGGLLGLISATLEGLYDQVAIAALPLDLVPYGKGLVLALGGGLAVAWPLAREAGRAPLLPRAGRSPAQTGGRAGLAFALGLSLLALMLLRLPSGYLGALLALAAILLAGAQGVGPVTALLLRGLNRLAVPLPLRLRLPLREASRGLGRAQLALAALVVALATAVGMTIMVSSFRLTVADWLEDRLDAPVLARGQALGSARGPLEAALEAARRDGLVSGWVWRQSVDDWLEGMPVRVTLLEAEGHEAPSLRLSEPLARQLGRTAGGALAWPGRLPDGEFLAPYYRSYGGGRLELEMPRALWAGPAPAGPWGLAVYGAPEAVLPRLQAALPRSGELLAQGPVKARALAIFDRTFRVTAVLQTIAGVVAGVGLLSAFAALALDRRQQLSALRILGAPGPFAARQLLLEAGLLAGIAGLLALPLGALAAWVLCDAVNLRAFHWTLALHWPPAAFFEALLLALAAGLLAALGPALRTWRAPAAEALEVLRAQG